MQQKHFSSLFSVLPSGRLPAMRVGVVELQPCALRVLLLHPQEAVPGWHPALPGLVRRVRLHTLNPGTHPCWGQQGASHTSPWEPWSPALPPAWEAPAQANPPQQCSDTNQGAGTLSVGQLPGICCRVRVSTSCTGSTGSMLCCAGEASAATAGTALGRGFSSVDVLGPLPAAL